MEKIKKIKFFFYGQVKRIGILGIMKKNQKILKVLIRKQTYVKRKKKEIDVLSFEKFSCMFFIFFIYLIFIFIT